jgi:lipoate-protein ligase A
MAVDEALLESAGRGDSPPTLRLYDWRPACLSLGYAQSLDDVDMPRLAAHGWEVVRRPTGGRAILHVDELTYSVTGPAEEPRLAGDVLASYRRLSAAILGALERLGLAVSAMPEAEGGNGAAAQPVCFEVPSHYEITFGGKKLVGSAQARRREGVLQHGTLPLHGNLARITEALAFESEEARAAAAARLLERAATVESALGRPVPWRVTADAFREAFAATLNLTFAEGDLTPAERARARELLESRYTSPERAPTR